MVKNDIAILTSGCDPRPGTLLDITNTSDMVDFRPKIWVADGNDDTLIAEKYYFKITFYSDF